MKLYNPTRGGVLLSKSHFDKLSVTYWQNHPPKAGVPPYVLLFLFYDATIYRHNHILDGVRI
jgi:hypothetical protein